MAKPKPTLTRAGKLPSTLLKVWIPHHFVPVRESIEAIEGVVRVEGSLNVWINPCYDKDEIVAEIKAVFLTIG